jgi:uncharacterized protein (TIGR03067 family)
VRTPPPLAKEVLKTMKWTETKAAATLLLAAALFGVDPLTRTAPAAGPGAGVATDVEKLQGTWNVVALEAEGGKVQEGVFKGSKIVVKGNAFTTVSAGATYRGTFSVDAAATPKTIDLTFTEGPEAGNKSLGIYEVDGDSWKLCLTVGSKKRPERFVTRAGSGHALETLRRAAATGPDNKRPAAALEGEWSMVSGEIGGRPMPEAFVKTGRRVAKGDETTVTLGGRTFLTSKYTVDTSKKPYAIDYTMTDGPTKGKTQLGIYELDGDTVRFCFAAPGKDRPTKFEARAGDEQTLSVWKKV